MALPELRNAPPLPSGVPVDAVASVVASEIPLSDDVPPDAWVVVVGLGY